MSSDIEKDKKIEKLQNQLQQKENIIKEVREYIELGMNFDSLGVARTKKKLLQILNKVGDEK